MHLGGSAFWTSRFAEQTAGGLVELSRDGCSFIETLAGATSVKHWTGEGGAAERHGSDGDHQTLVQQSTGAAGSRRETAGKEGRLSNVVSPDRMLCIQ